MVKNCKLCGSEFKEGGTRFPKVFCSLTCRTRFNSKKRYYRNRDNPEERLRRKETMAKWYQQNKERQYENVKRDRTRNKSKWNMRRWTAIYKAQLFVLHGSKCFDCGETIVLQLHHKSYDLPPFPLSNHPSELEKQKKINFLFSITELLCKKCHRLRHRSIYIKETFV